ncbi:tyrosine-type recombinase/integrase [Citrobacter koseri]
MSYIVRKNINGKSHYVPIGCGTQFSINEAREKACEIIYSLKRTGKIHGKDYAAIKNMVFGQLMDKYEMDVLSTGIKKSANTDRSKIKNYFSPQLGALKVADMTEGDVLRYLGGLELKPAIRNRHLALIKALFTYAVRMNFVSCSPARYIKSLPETTSQRKAMTDAQSKSWMETAIQMRNGEPDNAALALLVFLALTGLRLGETRHLLLEDIDWSRQTITLRETKNGKLRCVPVGDKAFVLLTEQRQLLGDKGWVFPGHNTTNPVAEPRRLQKRICEKAGISPFTIHEMRHTFATKLIESGADIHTIKDLLGHSTIKVTERYLHGSPMRYHEAINKAMDTFQA